MNNMGKTVNSLEPAGSRDGQPLAALPYFKSWHGGNYA